jgi:hypothetical protein
LDWVKAGCIAWLIPLAGCLRTDGGFIDPADPAKPVLGHFQGKTENEGDSTLSAKRLQNLTNPLVTLVWKFLGPKEFIITPSQGSVDTKPPYLFDLTLLDPPSPDVLDNPDLAIGGLWLFSDRNGNGKLDRLIHPEMAAATRAIDSAYGIYQAALKELVASGEVKPEGIEIVETYHIGKFGTVTLGPPGDEDTLFLGRAAGDTAFLESLFHSRFRTLQYQNRWEKFFSLRKRDNDYYQVIRPSPDHIYEIDMPINRRLFPKPGGRHEFERKMRAVIAAFVEFSRVGSTLLAEQVKLGHNQYPFDGFDEAGADWVAGRSRKDFILYIRDEAALRDLREAERTSSFTVKGMDKLRTGYNAVHCDDQYACEFLAPGSVLTIDLGQTEEYFNPPSTPLRKPLTVLAPARVEGQERLAGTYAFEPFYPVHIAASGPYLWAEVPEEGILRLTAADSLTYYATDRDLQLQFVPNDSGETYKLFIFKGRKKYVATRDSVPGPSDLAAGIASSLAADVPADPAWASRFAAAGYAYGKDTLRLAWTGDSLRVTVPGMLPISLVARDSLSFFSRQSDLRLDFGLDAGGGCTGVWVARAGKRIMAPALGYHGPGPAELFPGIADSLPRAASEHAGTGRDRLSAMDGGPRIVPGSDSLFLRAGDGWVDSVGGSGASDGISLRQGGDFLRFRVPGLEGKAMAMELTLCPQRGVKGRARLSVLGGADRDRQEDVLGAEFWADLDGKCQTVRLGPWTVPADPYYVRIGQVPTADSPFVYSFDLYRALTE